MKKFICLLAALLIITGCDDGEMSVKSFNFEDANVRKCGDNTYYKVNGTEILILTLNDSYFQNVESDPVIYQLSGSNSITYRNYSSTGGENTLCSNIPSASPSVIEEWNGEGSISIQTVAVHNAETGLLTGYSHKIVLVDISFTKGDEEIRIVDQEFGSVQTNLGYNFAFEFTEESSNYPDFCTQDNSIFYKIVGDETLVLLTGENTFPNTEGSQTIELSDITDDNSLLFNVYSSSAGVTNVCTNYALSPQLEEKWIATAGTIDIITTYDSTAAVYNQDVYFNNVVFTNASNSQETFSISDIVAYDEETGFYYGRINTQ